MRTHSQDVGAGRRRGRARGLLAAVLAGLLATAAAQVQVVASLPPYASLAALVAGDLAEVRSLLPAGASPHAFDPRPRDLRRVAGADLVLINGGLDAWLLELVEAGGATGRTLVVLDHLELEPIAGDDHDAHGDEEHGDEAHEDEAHPDEAAAGVNPHVWLDPILMRQVVERIGRELAEIDPANAERYRANAAAAAARLSELDAELRALLEGAVGRPFVPFHDAWPYFARRYGLELVVELEPFPGREPGPRYLAEALDAIRASGAPAIFAERQLGDRAARVLAAEAGVAVVVLDPLGESGPEGYEAMLRYNAEAIAAALGRGGP